MFQDDIESGDSSDMLVAQPDDVSPETRVKQLELRVAELEQENSEKDFQIEALKKEIEEQEQKFSVLKECEQELQAQHSVVKDKSVQDMCLLLELQHRELIRQQLKQVEETVTTSKVKPANARMIIINPNNIRSLNTATSLLNSGQTVVSLGDNVTIPAFNASNNHQTEGLSLELDCTSEPGSVSVKEEDVENEIESAENSELLDTVNQSILERTFPDSLDSDRLQTESTDTTDKDSEGPLHKKRKTSENDEIQNM